MKFRVFKENKLEEKELFFKLEETSYGDILLYVYDEKSELKGRILCIYQNGTLELFSGIPDKLGFQLDDKGKIKLED